jgi:endonuclease/exonuclease/phosphatase family metal-dependent hydrolase
MFLEKLAELRRAERMPLLVCGDFNSLPDSGVYALVTGGSLARDHQDLRSHSYVPCPVNSVSDSLSGMLSREHCSVF